MVDEDTKSDFLEKLRGVRCDALLITGDISNAKQLVGHLNDISAACGERPVFFTLGNHDYFFGSMCEVEKSVVELCDRTPNLIPLGQGEVIQLSPDTALVGHRGWYDGRAGDGERTEVVSPDQRWINDFKHLNKRRFFKRMRELGEESANYFRKVLPSALGRYRNVLVATHVPPCYQALKYNGEHCRWERQPFYANCSAGEVLIGLSRVYPRSKVTVYAGHSHSAIRVGISSRLDVQVAGARTGRPELQEVVSIH